MNENKIYERWLVAAQRTVTEVSRTPTQRPWQRQGGEVVWQIDDDGRAGLGFGLSVPVDRWERSSRRLRNTKRTKNSRVLKRQGYVGRDSSPKSRLACKTGMPSTHVHAVKPSARIATTAGFGTLYADRTGAANTGQSGRPASAAS